MQKAIEIEARAKNVNNAIERDVIRISISSFVQISPIIDSFSTWLLAGCGAIAGLMITNVSTIVPFLGKVGFKISIYILAGSVLAGLFQKYRSICVQSFISFSEKLVTGANSLNSIHQKAFEELNQEAANHGFQLRIGPSLNLERIKNEFSNLLPFFLRKRALKHFDKGSQDDLHGWRRGLKSLKHQIAYFIIQFCLFLIFLSVAASSI